MMKASNDIVVVVVIVVEVVEVSLFPTEYNNETGI